MTASIKFDTKSFEEADRIFRQATAERDAALIELEAAKNKANDLGSKYEACLAKVKRLEEELVFAKKEVEGLTKLNTGLAGRNREISRLNVNLENELSTQSDLNEQERAKNKAVDLRVDTLREQLIDTQKALAEERELRSKAEGKAIEEEMLRSDKEAKIAKTAFRIKEELKEIEENKALGAKKCMAAWALAAGVSTIIILPPAAAALGAIGVAAVDYGAVGLLVGCVGDSYKKRAEQELKQEKLVAELRDISPDSVVGVVGGREDLLQAAVGVGLFRIITGYFFGTAVKPSAEGPQADQSPVGASLDLKVTKTTDFLMSITKEFLKDS